MTKASTFLPVLLVLLAPPAAASVQESSDSGFTVTTTQRVTATPAQVWAALAQPARWWSSQHSWSGDAKNLSLDPVVGGCFCERWGANGRRACPRHLRAQGHRPSRRSGDRRAGEGARRLVSAGWLNGRFLRIAYSAGALPHGNLTGLPPISFVTRRPSRVPLFGGFPAGSGAQDAAIRHSHCPRSS